MLFFRDVDPDVDVRLSRPGRLADLVGEDSRDARGDAVSDVLADVHLEACVSTWALDVAEVSLSAEFRLDRLASKPDVCVVGFDMVALSWLDLPALVLDVLRDGRKSVCRVGLTNEPRHVPDVPRFREILARETSRGIGMELDHRAVRRCCMRLLGLPDWPATR